MTFADGQIHLSQSEHQREYLHGLVKAVCPSLCSWVGFGLEAEGLVSGVRYKCAVAQLPLDLQCSMGTCFPRVVT